MQNKPFLVLAVIFSGAALAAAKERSPQNPVGWGYVASGPVEIRVKSEERARTLTRLNHGALVPVMSFKEKGKTKQARIQVVDMAELIPQTGWIDSSRVEVLPWEQFPKDADLLRMIGGPYLDDFTAAHTQIARFLVKQGSAEPALVCFLGSRDQPSVRLQVFERAQGKFLLGPYVEFASSEMQSGISSLEIRDLLGDGNECLISREPFRLALGDKGVSMVIRRIEHQALTELWEAPLESRNLEAYPARIQVLQPPERNIGAAGTVTKGDVEFRARGSLLEPFWHGKVEFHVVGREEATDSVKIEKLCPWDGTKFSPLK